MNELVHLSVAEFLVLHALHGEPECPGVDLPVLQQSAGDPDIAMRAGLESLLRRGLVTRRGTTLDIRAELALLGQVLFFPEVSTLRWDETEAGPDGFASLNVSSGVALRWTLSPTRWEGALSMDLAAALASLCHPVPPRRPVTASVRVPRATFLDLRDLAYRDADAAERTLRRAPCVEGQSAATFVNALARSARQHVFAVLRLHDGLVTGADNVLVFVGGGDAWRVTVAPDDATALVCEAVERNDVAAGLRLSIEALRAEPTG